MKLVYHNEYNSKSPFDQEIISIVNDDDIIIVCPYIGISYLKRIIKQSKSWKLITDIQEWILSYPSQISRLEIVDFITKYHSQIKHIDNIHAKVISSENRALIGSANFTEKGICERTEMSVVIDDEEKIIEIKEWFNFLWKTGLLFKEDELKDFLSENIGVNNSQIKIIPLNKSVVKNNYKASLVDIDTKVISTENTEEHLFVSIKNYKKDIEWWNRYFDLLKDAFSYFQIECDSPKIAMTTRKDLRMPVNIGQRWVIIPDESDFLGIIMSLNFLDIASDFEAYVYDNLYFKNNIRQALWCSIDEEKFFSNNELIDMWKIALKDELARTKKSSYTKYHNPFYYKIVMDVDYRKKVLSQIIN